MKKERFYKTYPLLGLLPYILLFIIPVFSTLAQSFLTAPLSKGGAFTFENIKEVFTNTYYLKIMSFTLYQAFLSTLIAVLIGLPGAYIMTTYDFPGKKILKALYNVPFVLPSILVVLGFVIFFGNNGFLNKALMAVFHLEEPPLKVLYSFKAVIMAHAFYNFPVTISIVSEYWKKLDNRCEMAAVTLGSSRREVFRKITLPRLLPAILSSASLIFLFCFTSFAIILVLGGGPSLTTTEVEIYRLAKTSLDTQKAAALSLYSLFVAVIVLLLYSFFQRKEKAIEAMGVSRAKITRKTTTVLQVLGVIVYILASLLFILCPIVSIVVRSFLGNATRSASLTFSTEVYSKLFSIGGSSIPAIINSLLIGIGSALLGTDCALRLSTLATKSKGKFGDVLIMLPMATSSIIVGFSYFVISKYMSFIPSVILILLAHMIITIPFISRTILPVYRKIPSNLTKASRTLGFTERQTFYNIERPILRPSIFTGMAFAFALSIGELNATMVAGLTRTTTIPIQIYRLIASYNYQGACALGVILIAISFLVFIVCESLKRNTHV
ncbi:MAG: iron ABC transporter permease [Sphaerochaetaceae bacterium]|nr:iron ABC transporter permease [Sphaerochaetaceae bacterium]